MINKDIKSNIGCQRCGNKSFYQHGGGIYCLNCDEWNGLPSDFYNSKIKCQRCGGDDMYYHGNGIYCRDCDEWNGLRE